MRIIHSEYDCVGNIFCCCKECRHRFSRVERPLLGSTGVGESLDLDSEFQTEFYERRAHFLFFGKGLDCILEGYVPQKAPKSVIPTEVWFVRKLRGV